MFKWTPLLLKDWYNNVMIIVSRIIRNRDPNSHLLPRLKKYNIQRAVNSFTDSRFVTVNHGDFWANNFMVREDGEGNLEKVRSILDS